MDWSTVAELLRLDLRAAVAAAAKDVRLRVLRKIDQDFDEGLAWAKKALAVAIADEVRGRSKSPEDQATQSATVDRLKSAVRALQEKRQRLQEMIRIVSREKARTHSPKLPLPGTERSMVKLRAEVDPPRGYSISKGEPPAVLRVSGPPGGIDTLAVHGTPYFFEGHEGVVAMWGMADPDEHGKAHDAGAQFEHGTIRIQGEDVPAVAYLQRYMQVRYYVTMVAAVPVSGAVAVVCRRMESRDEVPWDRLSACPLLSSLRIA